jgi:hypothetical protein
LTALDWFHEHQTAGTASTVFLEGIGIRKTVADLWKTVRIQDRGSSRGGGFEDLIRGAWFVDFWSEFVVGV